jgi:hypothetical protein
MRTFCARLARCAKLTNWRLAHGRNARRDFRVVSFYRVRFDLAGGWHARIVRTTGFARVAELADAYGSGPYGETRGGSSPLASSPLISPPTLFESEGYRQPSLPIILVDYLRAVFLRAAQRAFINCESLLRPAGVSPPFFAEGAAFVPPDAFVPLDLLLAAQRAFISSDSFLRPAAVSAPFFLAGAGFVPPFSLAQRALAAAESLARVEGEK